MPISSRTIQNSIDFAKRMSYNRNPVIGNSLQPAIGAAQMVAQTILAPPFDWWWNNLELQFTCSPTPNSATASTSTSTGGTLTVTATNTFAVGNQVIPTLYTGALASFVGQIFQIASATGSSFTITLPAGAATGTDTSAAVWTNVTTQDYTVAVPSFSHIEHASVLDLIPVSGSNPVTYTNGKWWELEVKNEQALESVTGRPAFICPYAEDGSGNMTFRLSSAPDKPYPVSIHIQMAAPTFATLGVNSTWGPIPDYMQYIYDWGFTTLMWQSADDNRWQWANAQFKAGLLARASGLTDEERNIFLNNWDALTGEQQMKKQQGVQARGQ